MDSTQTNVTELLARVRAGDEHASNALYAAVHSDLRARAELIFRDGARAHTLQATELVHEVYLKLAQGANDWSDRKHFVAVATRAMRQILCDRARAKRAVKRPAEERRVTFSGSFDGAPHREFDLVELDDLFDKLAAIHPDHARLLELRVLGGATVEEAAEILGASPATLYRRWRTVEAWLRTQCAAG